MQILLYILLVIQIINGTIGFFALVTNLWYVAIIYLILSILQAVLTIVVIDSKNRITNLELNIDSIFSKLKKLEKTDETLFKEEEFIPPATKNRQASIGAWECIKCGTINKIGSTHCSNCKADYSPEINPTVNPNDKKKKISRWIKYK
ncbi:MAG: hypothetical protein IJY79_00990 [Clostridia bacterium]|nr:hypothetical protein [Clostridia bacterium]